MCITQCPEPSRKESLTGSKEEGEPKDKDQDGNRPGVKESVRWVEGYERLAEMAAELPETRLVYVADIMALMVKAQGSGTPVDWLVRSQHNRALKGGEKLWARVSGGKALSELRFTMPEGRRTPDRPRRCRNTWNQHVTLIKMKAEEFKIIGLPNQEDDHVQGQYDVKYLCLQTTGPAATR